MSAALKRLAPLLVLLAVVALVSAGPALASGITNSADDLRDGWYPDEASLTPQLISGGTFGQLWSTTVDGQVYAQPLLANGTLLVATENDEVYGLDPATGAQRWPAPLNLGPAWKPADIGCGDLTPNIGVTATPVINPATNTAYLTHKTYASGTSGTARWYMDAVNLTSGTEKAGFPVQLSGAAQNQPGETFQPTTELQRPGLLLMNGVVYAAFGSHCDISPWQGWVFGVSTAGEVKARWVDVPGGNGAGIWQSGTGLMSDGSGTLLISTGNTGAPSTPTPGRSPPATLGESVVRLEVQPDGSLNPVDFFAPFDAQQLDEWDADFASGGVTGLNEQFFGTSSVPHLAVAVGKDGYVYLLNRDNLGGFKQGPGGADEVVQRIGPYGGVWSRPGVWPGDGGWVYIPTASGGNSAGGSSGFLRVYQYGVSGTDQPTLSLQATSADAFGFTSSAPVITSDGTNSGSALVWTVWTPNGSGVGAQLRAYDPVPVGGKPVLRWSAPVGTSSKFATPGVGAGRLYVGTREGKVLGFGSPVTPLLTGPATNFPTTTLAHSSQKTLTLTATNALTLTKLTSSSSQFSVGTPSLTLPARLSAGQTIQVPLTFTPIQTGLVGGPLTAETDQGAISVAMSGIGQAESAQLATTPPVVSFGGTTIGGHLSGAATFRNVGGAPLTIDSVNLPAAPFRATGVPKAGDTIASGASITVTIAFDPTAAGNFSDEIGLETTGGWGSIGLAGSAGSATFGPPPTADSMTPISGPAAGGTSVTIEGSHFLEGATVTIGSAATDVKVLSAEEITAKTSATAAGSDEVIVSDENGTSSDGPTYTYTAPAGSSIPDPAAGGWQLNGTAAVTAGELALTTATSHQAGSAFWPTPIDPRNITVEFDSSIGGGTGADGLALVLADASRGATATSLGVEGGGLGFSEIPGIAVALDEYQNAVNPSSNFVGISDGSSTITDALHWLATSNLARPLQDATHHVSVVTAAGTLTVSVDGTQLLSQAVTLPSSAYLGFSGGTGALNNRHAIAHLILSSEAAPAPASPQAPTTLLPTTLLPAMPLQQGLGSQGTLPSQEHRTPPVPDAELASTALTASSSGTVRVNVSCPTGESSCAGTVTLRTLTAVIAAAVHQSKRQRAAILTLASGTFKVAGGHATPVKLHLSAKARTLLARSHVLRARATIVAHDPAGATHTKQATVTIGAAQTRHGRKA